MTKGFAPQTPQEVQPASPVVVHAIDNKTAKDSAKGKLSVLERRARHREVVKRDYQRNKVGGGCQQNVFDRRWY
ncbi:hypothetical protein DVH05_018174 [Phytophthora capsici]|nr:hypothetical protein DVH05_018174 [Phytophthora capsici]